MTRMLVIEWAPHNIRVNAVAPATVMTESRQQMLSHPKVRANALSGIPCGWLRHLMKLPPQWSVSRVPRPVRSPAVRSRWTADPTAQ
jgi:NAD(P)-dependent dehydrogenase (short-subunit alcohol dehydrogenase family)